MTKLHDTSKSGIYVITNTVNGHYYGGRAYNFKTRWQQHIYDLKNQKHENEPLQRAWNKYGADKFEFAVLEYCEPEKCAICEQVWLDEHCGKPECYNLSPYAIGGALKGNKNALGNKNRLGKTFSEESRQRMSESGKRRPPISLTTRNKLSASKKGHPVSEETRHKLSKANKNPSEETRQKIGAAQKGKSVSEETRRKQSESARKKPPVSDETRLKQSVAAKRRWEQRRTEHETNPSED